MSHKNKFTTASLASVSILCVIVLWIVQSTVASGNDEKYYKIDRGLHYLREVFETLSRNYVDDIDPEALSKAAIDGMLQNFDPYTVFFKDPGSQQMNMITRGKYGGIGIEISVQNRHLVVIAPMEGTPAKRAGIRAGDMITKIDGKSTENFNIEDATAYLRGRIGEPVTLEITRPGSETPFELTLVREEIVLEDVAYADFIAPGVAYFRLTAFSDKALTELKDAIARLQKRAPIQKVILDLRGNPGGLLSAAVDIANIFLPPGHLVVSTRGIHEDEHKFYTTEAPLLPDQPLVVLINQSSASAAEIVAGAIQDLDRGVLVGQETFGKGLVQKVYPIDRINGVYLKITTAKYYVPSGRLIQKEDYKGDTPFFVDHSDSSEYNTKTDYFTQNKRVVHGGGGIHPDVVVPGEFHNAYLQMLFTIDYLNRHPDFIDPKNVPVTDELLNEFAEYVEQRNIDFQVEGEKELQKFLDIAKQKSEIDRDAAELVEVALSKLQAGKQRLFQQNKNQIRELLIAEFAEKSGGLSARIAVTIGFDNQLQAALKVLQNHQEYREILAAR